ncbi:MAG: Hint domain-containing protein [Thalassovita sp.]
MSHHHDSHHDSHHDGDCPDDSPAQTYYLSGFAADDLSTVSGGAIAAGETLVLNSDWTTQDHRLNFTFTDSGDDEINGDDGSGNEEIGRDDDQDLTITDANGNYIDSGQGYAEDRITLVAPDGSNVYLYTIEIDGVFHGAVIDGFMAPGVHYEISAVDDVDNIVDPDYSTLDWAWYDNTDNSYIDGGDGDESLIGGDGDDTIYAGEGSNTVYGGAGNDKIDDDHSASYEGNNEFHGGDGNDTMWGGAGDDQLYGDAGDDNLYGEAGNDTISGGSGNDSITGNSGNDELYGGTGSDSLSGGDGNDTIYGGTDGSETGGTGGTNTVGDTFGVVRLGTHSDIDTDESNGVSEFASSLLGDYGGAGSELFNNIETAVTSDTNNDGAILGDDFNGTSETITIDGTAYAVDSVQVYNATVTLTDGTTGGFTAVVFQTTTGEVYLAPELSDNADNDLLTSGAIESVSLDSVLYNDVDLNSDRVDADWQVPVEDTEGDSIEGGAGDDLIYGGAGADTINAGDDNDTVFGGDGNDTIYGWSGADSIEGGAGDDNLRAGGGNDTILAGEGNDTLHGWDGDDLLTTGDGNDVVELGSGSGNDTVTDFDMADDDLDGFTNDQIDVSDLTDADGESVQWWDVSVTDDGAGNALLSFPNGETLLLEGVPPAAVSQPGQLYAMGVPCFVGGTLIETPTGQVAVETLKAGDLVTCADGRAVPITWAGGRTIDATELDAEPQLRPVVLRAGSIGNHRELRLSPQHAIAVRTPYGGGLARAVHLSRRKEGQFRVANGVTSVTYHHLLLPQHALIRAEGAWVESLWPGPMAVKALGPKALIEIACAMPALLPALNGSEPAANIYGPAALTQLSGREVRELSRIEAFSNLCPERIT